MDFVQLVTRHSSASRSELQVLWRQHGVADLLPTVEPFVQRVGVLADEGLRDLCVCNIVEDLERFVFSLEFHHTPEENLTVCDLVAATSFSVLTALSLWKKMILSSPFPRHPVSTQNCWRSGRPAGRWAHNL